MYWKQELIKMLTKILLTLQVRVDPLHLTGRGVRVGLVGTEIVLLFHYIIVIALA